MTERLYYHDPALLEFTATITVVTNEGEVYLTTLDRSAFYPTSGGQLFDTGQLNGVDVIDVRESEAGEVLHISRQPIGSVGSTATGLVDTDRRHRNRQLHSAQHILSQSFIQRSNYETVSVHLGEEYGAVELNSDSVSPEQSADAELLANQIIWRSLPVSILFVDASDAANLPLRKIPDREGVIRVIKVGEFDYSACGGTHCANTSEIGLIKITGIERLRGRALVTFLAGRQAWEDYRTRFAITDRLSKQLTCNINDLEGRYAKLVDESKSLHRQAAGLQKELLPVFAERLAAQVARLGPHPFVCAAPTDIQAEIAGPLAQQVAEKIGGVSLLVVENKLYLATGSSISLNAGDVMKKLSAAIGLRGGGSPRLAQAGGASADALETYRSALEKLLV